VTLDDWVHSHRFLEPIALMRARIDAAVDAGASATAMPAWDDYAEDFGMGMPLLRSFDAAVDLEPAGRRIVGAIDQLASGPERDPLTGDARALSLELDGVREPPHRLVVDWLLELDAVNPQTTARLAATLGSWRMFDEGRQALMRGELERLAARPGLSRDTGEIVGRLLGGSATA